MKSWKSRLLAGVAVVAMTLTAACGGSLLNTILVWADAGLAAIQVAVPGPWTTVAAAYLNNVGGAVSATTTELASMDTDVVKGAKIADIWARAALPDLTNVPAPVASVLKLVDAAVKAFLASIQGAAQAAMAHGLTGHVTRPNFLERHQLNGIRSHAQKIQTEAQKYLK